MADERPGIFEMIRAYGLLAMLAPLTISTSVAVIATGELDPLGLFFAAVLGFSMHVSMNIYNDIYDTKQGCDTLDSGKSIFSGGSAVMVRDPGLEERMFTIARGGLVVGFLGALGLIHNRPDMWPIFIFIFVTAAFLSKYYTAEPFKLAYRGLGEIAVWAGFGPFAILLYAAAQGIPFHPLVVPIMPVTGLSTLIFAWGGEMTDMPYDEKAGKRGLVLRMGLRKSIYGLLILHLLLIANVLLAAYLFAGGWILLPALIPYLLLLPGVFTLLEKGLESREKLYEGTRLNFFSFVLFSVSIMAGFLAMALL
ncbi:prenyltransferase [Methanolobus chelungpuianus]|uniref:Ubiquinone biosynthesis protein UbiA n=1 Tax=Methanolobus chelungpuianus TaxID=502115 RepID=A0AAE3HB89_9EURY|nr:prenyltransferase [Methanolobus chelungpuianus]MCQ6963405.1 ubiquinone biosynthesis protein UbiA [Methanolobus chelungpuianus]